MGLKITDLTGAFRTSVEKQIGKSNHSPIKATRREPNKWELAFRDEVLEPLRKSGAIKSYAFEKIRLKAGIGSWYKCDWCVATLKDGIWDTIYEIKGLRRADGISKIKAAAEINPGYRFIFVTGKSSGGWEYTEIGRVV